MSQVTVTKLSLWSIVGYFVFYLVTHVIIGVLQRKSLNKLEQNPNNEEIKKEVKILTFLLKWYPAIYVVFVILMFYAF